MPGGAERVAWALGKELIMQDDKVTLHVKSGSYCDSVDVIAIEDSKNIIALIPKNIDCCTFQFQS